MSDKPSELLKKWRPDERRRLDDEDFFELEALLKHYPSHGIPMNEIRRRREERRFWQEVRRQLLVLRDYNRQLRETPAPLPGDPSRTRPNPLEHTTAKVWTVKEGAIRMSTKTHGHHDGTVEFAPIRPGKLTNQMQFIQLVCFKFPDSATLAEVIAQVYPDDLAEVKQDPEVLKKTLRKLRSLVSDIRKKKFEKANLNPDILPPLSIESSMDTGIGLRLAHLHRLDDKEIDEADAVPN
jgi:hypothetical protein